MAGRDAPGRQPASEVYHSTPYAASFPFDDWTHLGTRAAALDRARQSPPGHYGLPGDTCVTLHACRLSGRAYPLLITDRQASDISETEQPGVLAGHGLPSGEGYLVFPYRNDSEDPGSISYLAHRSAIRHLRTETIPRRSL